MGLNRILPNQHFISWFPFYYLSYGAIKLVENKETAKEVKTVYTLKEGENSAEI
jgi:hypothetical protein